VRPHLFGTSAHAGAGRRSAMHLCCPVLMATKVQSDIARISLMSAQNSYDRISLHTWTIYTTTFHTVPSGSSVYLEACAACASCSLRASSRSAAHSAELAAAVNRNNMLNGGTSCRNRYTVPYLRDELAGAERRSRSSSSYQVYCHLRFATEQSRCVRS
jgi:hypothetical protein